MAKAMGVSPDTVNRVWRENRLQPHRLGTFKLSTDPRFVEKLTDMVGLYMNPPQHAVVDCVDEKSQIQALDRTVPPPSSRLSTCWKGSAVGQVHLHHRHQEFLKFLRRLDRDCPPDLDLHLGPGQLRHPQPSQSPGLAGE